MRDVFRIALILLGAGLLVAEPLAQLQTRPPLTLRVTTRARALRQGEVMLVSVTTSRDVTSVDGGAFAGPVAFWKTTSSRQWQGLLGIPLDTDTGRRDLLVRGTAADGTTQVTRVALSIAAGKFAERRLTVDERYADPPESEVNRILAEAMRLDDIFKGHRDGRLWRGTWRLPVPGTATSSFGRKTFLNGDERGRHQGADFRAASGTPIHAPNGGEVVLAQELYFSGNTVVLDHGEGLYSLFAHLSSTSVATGARVERGQVLGLVGATGRVTGPHLHWAVRLNNTSVDPTSLVHAVAATDDDKPPATASK
jgi:murein DD-endopeptidase MepM/ murein hydrolase activator NlpD